MGSLYSGCHCRTRFYAINPLEEVPAMTDPTYAVTVAEALRSLLGGMLVGAVIFTITFIIIRRKYERP
jgi:NhaP-type Na+/H+ or K+/H+ antiporter